MIDVRQDTRSDCFVYVLGSRGKGGPRTYVGWTLDVERRLQQHNSGQGARSTRGRVWVLLHSECHSSREAAMSREWHLKRDRKWRKALLQALQVPNNAIAEEKSPLPF